MSAGEPQAVTKLVEVSTGAKLYTERWQIVGAAQPAQTIVCIHGLGSSSAVFYPVVKPLLSYFPDVHILAYDRAGSGLSPLPDYGGVPLSVSHMLADLDALLTVEAPTGPLVMVAHSAGTILTTRWLLKASPAVRRVTRVIFLGGPPDAPIPPEISEIRLRMAGALETAGTPSVTDSTLPLVLGRTTMASRPLAVAAVRAITLAQDGVSFGAAIRALDRDIGAGGTKIDWEALQTKFRVLAICGDEDLLVKPSDIARYLDKSPVRTLVGVGQ